MLAAILRSGQRASSAASMRSLAVVNTPCLPARRAASSSALQVASTWLSLTSKCWASRASTSGNTARATRTEGLDMAGRLSDEEDEREHDEQRHQHGARPGHVAEEAGHGDAALLGNRLDHQVGRVADVRVGAHEHGA